MKKICIFVPIFLLAACAVTRPTYNITAPFDAQKTANALKNGNNTIRGEAFLRQNGGMVVTCAGSEVSLYPVTEYSAERITALYNSKEGGYNPIFWGRKYNFIPDEPQYYELEKKTVCNSSGNFEFKDLKDGSYYIITTVSWYGGNSTQGGNLARKVEVKGGEVKDIIITQ